MISAPLLRPVRRSSLEMAPGVVCHASTILPTRDGDVLCAWFQGTREGADDVRIGVSRGGFEDTERVVVMAPGQDLPHWNPVLHRLTDGRVRLFFKVGRTIASWETWVVESADDGRTWGSARLLVPDDPINRGPTRTKILELPSGRQLAPSSAEDGEWRGFVDISDDDGATWRRGPEIRARLSEDEAPTGKDSGIPVSEQSFAGRGVIQPTLWLDSQGHVRMLLRSSEGWLFSSGSHDDGETWAPATRTPLPNNNSGIDVVNLAPYGLFLVGNPVGVNWGPRTPLTVSWSGDEGGSWTRLLDLETGEGEYSYPAAVGDSDRLLISYTGDRRSIEIRELRVAGEGAG
jgi:predicted neuraminidase